MSVVCCFSHERAQQRRGLNSAHHIGTREPHIPGEVNLPHLAKVTSAMVSTEKCLFFLCLFYSWEQGTKCSPPSVEEGGLTSACRRGHIYICHMEPVRKIWLLNHFFASAWTCVHLLYSLGYDPIPPYFLAQVVPALVPRSCCVPETCPSSCFFTTSFLSGSIRSTGSSCIFSAQPYNQPFLQEPWFSGLCSL